MELTMAQAKRPKAAAEAAFDPDLNGRVAASARDIVRRGTEAAKQQTDGLYDVSKRCGSELEMLMQTATRGYVDVLANVAEAAHAQVTQSIAATEQLARAETLEDAVQVQVDFANAQATQAYETAEASFAYLRDAAQRNAALLQESMTRILAPAAKAS